MMCCSSYQCPLTLLSRGYDCGSELRDMQSISIITGNEPVSSPYLAQVPRLCLFHSSFHSAPRILTFTFRLLHSQGLCCGPGNCSKKSWILPQREIDPQYLFSSAGDFFISVLLEIFYTSKHHKIKKTDNYNTNIYSVLSMCHTLLIILLYTISYNPH